MNKMCLLFLVSFYLLTFYNCKEENKLKDDKPNVTKFENNLKAALVSGFYSQMTEDIGLSLYHDDIYYIHRNRKGFDSNKFLLHLIKEDNSFVNKDFLKDSFVVKDNVKGIFKNLDIIHRKIDYYNYDQIRTGQFRRLEDGSTQNIWSKQARIENVINKNEIYKNQIEDIVGINLVHENFESVLTKGVFFKIYKGFYLLLSEDYGYLIMLPNSSVKEKIMWHLIKEDNTFDNFSFNYWENQIDEELEFPFSDYQISKVYIPRETFYIKLRVGQFNADGNIWVQEIMLEEVKKNDLLKYNGELRNHTKK